MPKGYWIAHVTVDDPAAYEGYRKANAVAFARYGGRFLVRGGAQTIVEGDVRPRSVIVEFPSLDAATDCYHSAEYQSALAIRKPCSSADVVIVAGHEPT